MKRIFTLSVVAVAAFLMAACGGAADNKPANNANSANSNSAKTGTAPTADALLAMDKSASEAWIKGDSKFFENFLSDKFVSYDGGQRVGKAEVVKYIGENKCEVKEGWKLEEPQMVMIDADTYLLTYKGEWDGSCTGKDGKSMKIPSPVRAASVYARSGDKWAAVFHGENLIIDPKAPPVAEKKEEPKKEDAKKEEPMKDETKKDEKAADSATAPVKPVPDPNTDALVKLHTSGWEAFKAKDAKKFDELLMPNMVNVGPLGDVVSGKANVIKQWTETMKCEGINKVGITDGFASAISPTVELFTLKGTADGTCDGQKNGPLYQSAIYVKEGDAWKLAFMFESIAK